MSALEESNAALREAVKARMEATPADDPKMVGYAPSPLAGCEPAQACAAEVLTQAWQSESCCEGKRCVTKPMPKDETAEDSLRENYAEWEPGFQPKEDKIPNDWILRGERELRGRTVTVPQDTVPVRFAGDGVMNADSDTSAAEKMLLDAAAAVRDRRQKYGPPGEHFTITAALINAAFGTSFTAKDWATMMQLDKIARSRGPSDHPDNDIDGAGYAACRAECRAP